MNEIKMELDNEQVLAAKHMDGPCVVMAGPGSGKTTTLVSRVKNLINNGVEPKNILCVTFSRKAVDEMRNRISRALKQIIVPVNVMTVHVLCKRIVDKSIERYDAAFSGGYELISNDYAKVKLIQKWLEDEQVVDSVEDYPVYIHLERISLAKNKGMSPNDLATDIASNPEIYQDDEESPLYSWRETVSLYKAYERLKKENKRLDFDDLLFVAEKILTMFPDVLQEYQEKYRYIMVDEFQDINDIQFRVLYLLASGHRNIWVCGDYLQSIYEWRGARPEIIVSEFMRYFPEAKQYDLRVNYRSLSNIVSFSNKIAQRSKIYSRNSETLRGMRGGKVVIRDFPSEIVPRVLVDDLENELPNSKGEVAVLSRTNGLLSGIERELLQRGIGYRIHGDSGFFSSREVGVIQSYLHVAFDSVPKEWHIANVLKTPSRGLGDAFVKKFISQMPSNSDWYIYLTSDFGDYKWNLGAVKAYGVIRDLKNIVKRGGSAYDVVHAVRTKHGYDEWLKSKGSKSASSLDILDALEMMLKEKGSSRLYSTDPSIKWLDALVAKSRKMKSKNNDSRVVLSTIHGAKGLEFEYVFLPYVDEGVIPHSSNLNIEEELRLFYVAVTRASSGLYVYHGSNKSRFLEGEVSHEEAFR